MSRLGTIEHTGARSFRGHLRAALGFLTGYQAWIPLGAAVLVWHLTAPEKNVLNRRAGVVLDTLLNVVAALALRQAARNAQLPSGFRKGLHWIALGVAMVALGGVYVFIGSLVEPDSRAAFSPADFLFIAT